MRHFLFFPLLLYFSIETKAQSAPPSCWQYYGLNDYSSNLFKLDNDGNSFLVSGSNLLTKLSPTGDLLWQTILDDSASLSPAAIAVDISGYVYLALSDTHPWRIQKYSSDGVLLWESYWSSDQNGGPRSLTIDHDGNVILTGEQGSTLGGYWGDCVTLKYDKDGNLLWEEIYTDNDGAYGYDVTVDSADNIYVVAEKSCCDQDESNPIILKYNPSGDLVYAALSYIPTGYSTDLKIEYDNSGNIIIGGRARNIGWDYAGLFIKKFSTEGELLWSFNEGTEGDPNDATSQFCGFAIDSSDNIYVAGNWEFTDPYYDIGYASNRLTKLNPAGDIIWEKTEDSTWDYVRTPSQVAVNPEGACYVARFGSYYEPVLIFITKYDTVGNELWTMNFDTSLIMNQSAQWVAISTDNNSDLFFACNSQLDFAHKPLVMKFCEACSVSAVLSLPQNSYCLGDTIPLEGGTPPGGTYSGLGVIDDLLYTDSAGLGWHLITYTFSDSLGCTVSDGEWVEVEVCTGMESTTTQQTVTVNPNPFDDFTVAQFYLNHASAISIDIYDMNGMRIKSFLNQNNQDGLNQMTLNLGNISAGIYFLRLQSESNLEVIKLLVE